MSQQELLKKVIGELETMDVGYMLTGSFVSSLQGQPRSTHDIDLVVSLLPEQAESLLSAFPPPNYYLSLDAIREAIQSGKMFNLLDIHEGDKVDFWLLTTSPFDVSRFSRRRKEEIDGLSVLVSSPEDTILAKLRWAELSGGSEKQFDDALNIFEVQYDDLDLVYLKKWSSQLKVESLWQRLQDEAEVADPNPE